jgi:hypothetical protein
MKRGVSLSLEVVVVAALSLIVLTIMILIFTDKIVLFNQQADKCGAMGEACVPEADCLVFERSPNSCPLAGEVCCLNSCIADGGVCMDPCTDPDPAVCERLCPAGKTRVFRTGCPKGPPEQVCCK